MRSNSQASGFRRQASVIRRAIGLRTATPSLALVCAGAGLLAACGDSAEAPPSRTDGYTMPAPAPLPELPATPLDRARFRVTARDVRHATDEARVSIDRLDATLGAQGSGEADLHGVVAAGGAGADAWTIRSDALRVRDLRVLGDRRGATIMPARLVLDLPGGPRMTGDLTGSVGSDADGTLRVDGDVRVGASSIATTAVVTPSGDWNATLRLHPLQLADAHALDASIPAHGVARGVVHVAGAGERLRVRTDRLDVSTDRSALRLAGAATRAGERWSFDRVAVDLDPLHPEDWRIWFDGEPLVDAPMRGHLLAHGSGRDGVQVEGWVLAEDPDARLAADVDGTIWLEPTLRLDLAVESRALRLAGSGPFDLDVRLSGGPDSLALRGTARLSAVDPTDGSVHPLLDGLPTTVVELLASASARIDASILRADAGRRAVGTAVVIDSVGRVWLSLEGRAPLSGDGSVDLVAVADSLPLALVPVPEQVQNLQGFARARARVGGPVSGPEVELAADLVGVRFDVPEYGTGVDSMRARVRLAGDRIDVLDLRAFRGDGALTVQGGVQLAGALDLRRPAAAFDDARLDLTAVLDTMTVVDMDSARAVLAGRLSASGPLRRPHVLGRIEVIEGFVYEGKLAPDPPLDPADPPYADLVADAPWPDGRLQTAADERGVDAAPSPAPITAHVTLAVTPGFRIIDEDSDLGALGALRLIVDERGAFALGDARIVNGFYAYYGELFQLVGGAFAVDGTETRLAMSGTLRGASRPLGAGQGGYPGLDRRDPPIGIFGYATPATVLELLHRRSPLPATQPDLASLLLFDVPLQPVDGWDHELTWRGDEPDDLVGHRSAIQGSGLVWSYIADELYDYVPLDAGYLRAHTLRIGSRYPGWIMLGTLLETGVHIGPSLTVRASHVVGGSAMPGVGLRLARREDALHPADRNVEIFNEPRFNASLGTSGPRPDFDSRRRTGIRIRWRWDY